MCKTKMEYFAQSRDLCLPPRCPIIERCNRRIRTIELANRPGFMAKQRQRSDIIPEIGASVSKIGGTDNFIISNLCPEVPLFDSEYFYGGFTGVPLRQAQYDKYMDPQIEFLEMGHFSECAEFAFHNSNNYRGINLRKDTSVTNNTFHVSGSNSRVNYESIDNSTNINSSHCDLNELAAELARLREALILNAKGPDDFASIGRIAEAESAALTGDKAKVAPALAALGSGAKWVLGTAKDIGVSLAVKVLEQHIDI